MKNSTKHNRVRDIVAAALVIGAAFAAPFHIAAAQDFTRIDHTKAVHFVCTVDETKASGLTHCDHRGGRGL